MQTPFEPGQDETRTVYVKTVNVADLPQEVQDSAGDQDQLYAVHNAQGDQLALVGDRRMAFVLARQYDFSPVAVH